MPRFILLCDFQSFELHDQLYRKETFASDRERVEFLLARYEQITAPALALAAQKPKRGKKV